MLRDKQIQRALIKTGVAVKIKQKHCHHNYIKSKENSGGMTMIYCSKCGNVLAYIDTKQIRSLT